MNTIDTKIQISIDKKRIIAEKIYTIIKDAENAQDKVNYRGYNISLKDKSTIDELLNEEYIWFFGNELIKNTIDIKKEIINSLDGNSIAKNLSEVEEKSLTEMLDSIKKVQSESDISKITYYNGILVLKEDLDIFKSAYSNTLIGKNYDNAKTIENGQKIVANVEKNHQNILEIYSYNMQVIYELSKKEEKSKTDDTTFNQDFDDIKEGLTKLHKEIEDAKKTTKESEEKLDTVSSDIDQESSKKEEFNLRQQGALYRKEIMDLSIKMGMAYVNENLSDYYFYKEQLDKLRKNNNIDEKKELEPKLEDIITEVKSKSDPEFANYILYLDTQIHNASLNQDTATKCYYELVKEKDIKNHTISEYSYLHQNDNNEFLKNSR